MVLDCSNTTSLFELGFGANAVVALLSGKVANARGAVFDRFFAAAVAAKPTLRREMIDRLEIRDLIIRSSAPLHALIRCALPLQLCSLAIVFVSAATLYQLALWGSSCKMPASSLTLYCLTAFIILPFAYFSFGQLLDALTLTLTRSTIGPSSKLVALLVADVANRTDFDEVLAESARVVEELEQAFASGGSTLELEARVDTLTRRAADLTELRRQNLEELQRVFRQDVGAA